MKQVIIFFCLFWCISCSTHKVSISPFVQIYRDDWQPNILSSYIILRTEPKNFEIYIPYMESVFGEWNINNDTLFLFPKYEFFKSKYYEIDQEDLSIVTITQKYLIKKNCLIDITDYNNVFPELVEIFGNQNNNKTIYYKINSISN